MKKALFFRLILFTGLCFALTATCFAGTFIKAANLPIALNAEVQTSEPTTNINNLLLIAVIVLVVILVVAVLLVLYFKKQLFNKNSLLEATKYDNLTGLKTRETFCAEIANILSTAKPNEYMLISIDIDSFGIINEVYGYDVGTLVLQKVAKLLTESFSNQSLVSRDKDDVFLIFRSHTSSQRNICFKEMCDDCLEKGIQEILGKHFDINLSRGSYYIQNTQESVNHMIDLCHLARMKGKKIHGTTYFEFTQQMRNERDLLNKILFSMDNALKAGEFKIFYQPKVELKEFKIAGAEALVRWFTSTGDIMMPDSFIHIFEENGFISQLDFYVLDQVCKYIHKHSSLCRIPPISVNLSGVTLLRNANIVSKLSGILRSNKISRNAIEIEITESFFVNDLQLVIQKVEDLREAGFKISIDDFGAGVSSLNRLRDIKVDVLKLDKELLNYNLTQSRGTIVVGNIIKLAKNLMMEIVAEGVEQKDHLDMLRLLKCDLAQGFIFEKPLEESDFLQILVDKKDYSVKPETIDGEK